MQIENLRRKITVTTVNNVYSERVHNIEMKHPHERMSSYAHNTYYCKTAYLYASDYMFLILFWGVTVRLKRTYAYT